MALTMPGLAACLIAFALLPKDRLLDPLTLLLAACTLFASVAWVDLDERLLIDASFVPSVLAMGFLGPAPAFAIVVVGELGRGVCGGIERLSYPSTRSGSELQRSLLRQSSRPSIPLGCRSMSSWRSADSSRSYFNDLVLTSLIGVLDDTRIVERLRGHLSLLPAISIDLMLALATASLYSSQGLSAIAVVLVAIIAFNYMVTQMLKARGRARHIAELAASRHRLVVEALNAEDRERRRLSERLHDEAIQDLLIARQDLADARHGNPAGLPRVEHALDNALRELRATVFDLHPTTLDNAGLAPALEAVATQQARAGSFQPKVSVDPCAAGLRDRLLFAVSRELITNVAKHADARVAEIEIARDGPSIVLDVRDDGHGFNDRNRAAAVRSGHIGLASIAERIEAVGGTVDISSAPGAGAHIRVVLPAAGAEA